MKSEYQIRNVVRRVKKWRKSIRIKRGGGGGSHKIRVTFLDFGRGKSEDRLPRRPWNRVFRIFQTKSTTYDIYAATQDITCRCFFECSWLSLLRNGQWPFVLDSIELTRTILSVSSGHLARVRCFKRG